MVSRGKSENSEMKVKSHRIKAELKYSFTSARACKREEFKGGTRKKGASQKHREEQVENFYFPQMASIDPSKEAAR